MLPIFEIFLNEDEDSVKLSLVEDGAIRENFIYFKENEKIKLVFNDEKHIVVGPAMVPDKLIYRNDSLGERYVFYSENSIIEFADMFLNKFKNKINIDHSNKMIDARIIESYFAKEDNEFNVAKGSWIIALKILDDNVWSRIKEGSLKAFSIEGMFVNQLVEMAIQNQKTNMKENLKEKLLKAIDSIFFETTEVVEETKEEVKENFELVETAEIAIDVDEKVAEAQMIVEETAPEALTIEMVKTLLEELRKSILEELNPVMEEMKELKTEVSTTKDKVEEFSNQAIVPSVTEEVTVTSVSKNEPKSAKFFKNIKN